MLNVVCGDAQRGFRVRAARVTVDQKKTGGDTRVVSIWSPSGDEAAVAAAKASCKSLCDFCV